MDEAPNRHRAESGQTLIMFVLALGVLLGFCALAIDAGVIFVERRHAQNAADAAALAGASGLPPTGLASDAFARAQDWASRNGYVNGADDTTVTVTWPYDSNTQLIEVEITRPVDFKFGRVLGLDVAEVSARAVAELPLASGGAATDASIIALNATQCKALEINASAAFKTEGAIKINSECGSFAAEISCSASCQADGGIESVGGVKKDEKCTQCNVTTIEHFEDPLKDVLPPCFPNSPTPCANVGTLTVRNGTPSNPQPVTSESFNFQPGIYYGGIEVGGNTSTFAPGIYVMAGGGFKLDTSSSFQADGVFIYNTSDPDCLSCGHGGFRGVEINTSAAANITPMTSGPYHGLLFFQDRTNTQKAIINPSAAFGRGTLYFPNAHIDINPSANARVQVIADTIKINSNGSFTAGFNGDDFFQGLGAGPLRLVE